MNIWKDDPGQINLFQNIYYGQVNIENNYYIKFAFDMWYSETANENHAKIYAKGFEPSQAG